MSLLDVFAWIVVVVLVASLVAQDDARPHCAPARPLLAEAVTMGSWAALIFGFVFWPLVPIWAYVDAPGKRETRG